MKIEARGRKYEILKGSDIDRDGVYVELNDITGDETVFLLEIFHSDESGDELLNSEKSTIPFEVLKQVIEVADKWLKP